MLVLDTATLRVRTQVALSGDFVFDAISPDGATLYLVQYSSDGNPTNYSVRAYDVPAHQLLAKPIVDPHEPGEKMRGLPVTRLTSPDGAWAYTLYDGGGGTPFLHALDTRHRTARCISLPRLTGDSSIGQRRFRLSPDGGRLNVVDGPHVLTTVDTRTFRVSSPALLPAAAAKHPAASSSGGGGTGAPWGLIGGIGLALLLAGAAVAIATRRSVDKSPGQAP
jgi:DNA-binding beta-propeller fold protein YncE